jgi:hypothetical protein
MSKAVQTNVAAGATTTQIVAIDPYTADRVAHLPFVDARRIGGAVVTAADLALDAGDLLFIDSTHSVRTGSELAHIYLELLPALAPGVIVHIHDICLPYLYTPDIYDSMFDWQETTLLAALLCGNPSFATLACMSALFHAEPDVLAASFPEFSPQPMTDGVIDHREGHFPASFWMKRLAVPAR